MLNFFKRLFSGHAAPAPHVPLDEGAERIDREIDALYSILAEEAGSDRLVIKAGKMDAMRLMRSPVRAERVLALERIVYENPTIERVPTEAEIPAILVELSERIADIMARRSMEDKIEQKIQEKLEENHQDYVQDIRMQVLKDEKSGLESPQAAKKREELEALDIVGGPVSEFGIAFAKDNTVLQGEVQKVMDEMKADGTMAKISTKWYAKDITK